MPIKRKYARKRPPTKPRYVKRKRMPKTKGLSSTMYNKVATLVNSVEKKPWLVTAKTATPLSLAQYNVGGPGFQTIEITPRIVQGDDGYIVGSSGYLSAQRVGNKISSVSMHSKIQLKSAGGLTNGMRVKIMLCLVPDNPNDTLSNVFGRMMEPNVFLASPVIDYNSDRSLPYMNQVKILKTIHTFIRPNLYATDTTLVSQTQQKIISFGYKWKNGLNHVFPTNSSIDSTKNRLFLAFLADTGNADTTESVDLAHNTTVWYVDN